MRYLQTPGLLAHRPLIGLIMVLVGGIAFGVLAFDLQTHGPLVQFDIPLINTLHGFALQSTPFIRDVMIFGYYLGQHGVLLIGAVLCLSFAYKQFWPELIMVVVAWAGEGSIWLVLTNYFHRQRPHFAISVWHQMTEPGFPSGHSLSAVMCFGLLAYLLVPKISTRSLKVVVSLTAVLIILYIGFSRIFVGDHYLTDVLAGYAVGIAWSGLAFTSIELIFKKQINERVQERVQEK